MPDFDTELEGFCQQHIARRNAELHSGELPFQSLSSASWLSKFYQSIKIMLAHLGSDLEHFIGVEHSNAATRIVDAAADATAESIKGDISAHAKVWEGKEESEKAELASHASSWAQRRTGHRVKCPSCDSDALVVGEAIAAPETTLEDDEIIERQQHLPDKFECLACGLKISGLSKLSACGLGDAYVSTSVYDASEYYRPDDEYQGFEDDNNERF